MTKIWLVRRIEGSPNFNAPYNYVSFYCLLWYTVTFFHQLSLKANSPNLSHSKLSSFMVILFNQAKYYIQSPNCYCFFFMLFLINLLDKAIRLFYCFVYIKYKTCPHSTLMAIPKTSNTSGKLAHEVCRVSSHLYFRLQKTLLVHKFNINFI